MKETESNQRGNERETGGSTLGECDTLSVAELVVRWANAASVQVPLKDVRSHRQIARGGFEAGARLGSWEIAFAACYKILIRADLF